ncbi:MAG: SEL1-like repeat protein [Magnetococcales bacterium]|nr:SEL1-like repeat protein [Magnetococcales bacterium]MBF0115531.1 SEL1-like repeat protein [Magnetococcales bacterium]
MDEIVADLLKLAEQGDADAQFKLGFMYAKGITVAMDGREAFKWLGKAAEQGHTGADFELKLLQSSANA